jgi:cytidylate kinase
VNVEQEIRGMEVSRNVSKVSTIDEIRKFLVAKQQFMGKDKGVVMDGRDIGTVVFPEAELKIFMTAAAEVRAKRRYDELIKKGIHVNYQEILHNVKERDYIDSNRASSPLSRAEDAITLDNTSMTKEEQAKLALTWAKGVIKMLSLVK